VVLSHQYQFIFIKTAKVAGTSIEMFLNQQRGSNDVFTPHWQNEKNYIAQNYQAWFNPCKESIYRHGLKNVPLRYRYKATYSDFIERKCYFENIPAWQLKLRLPSAVWNSYFKFTIERNPWDKCISRYYQSKAIYEEKYRKELSFENWFLYVVNKLNRPWETQAWGSEAPYNWPRYTDIKNNAILVDQIIRYENLYEELESLCKQWQIPFNHFNQIRAKHHFKPKEVTYRNFFKQDKEPYIEKIANLFRYEIAHLNYTF
jgi:hypothetical protein